ncbi:uncharacterized protein LOC129586821 isoform X2 [Paramacrobiotus metropolitanus]|nr:uncharacterized protein LOC129586821 isoform X2 [Paramacrobiotus metropolitanus]XP_055336244.1 uncharacterized protein LOC129586821 isoform X2 [Paramacrobiotus metropolitanus]
MTAIAVLISIGTCVHGIVILSAASQLAVPRMADYVDADHMAIWYIILGVSNLVAGLGGAAGNGVLLRKMHLTWQKAQTTAARNNAAGTTVQVVGGPPRYTVSAGDAELTGAHATGSGHDLHSVASNSPPPAYAISPDQVVVLTSEPPPSYEASLHTPAVFIISASSSAQTGGK